MRTTGSICLSLFLIAALTQRPAQTAPADGPVPSIDTAKQGADAKLHAGNYIQEYLKKTGKSEAELSQAEVMYLKKKAAGRGHKQKTVWKQADQNEIKSRIVKAQKAIDELDVLTAIRILSGVTRTLTQTDLHLPENSGLLGETFVRLGKAFESAENLPAARHCYEIAYAAVPKSPTAEASLARILLMQNDREHAASHVEHAKETWQHNAYTARLMATVESIASNSEQEEIYLRSALTTCEPHDKGFTAFQLARCLVRRGNIQDALANLKIAEQNANSQYVAELFKAFSAQVQNLQVDRENACKAAGKLKPDDPGWHENIAELYGLQGKKDLAELHFNEALKDKRFMFNAYGSAANYLRTQKRYDDAMQILDHAKHLQPWNDRIDLSRGDIFRDKGQTAAALVQYKLVLKLNPDSTQGILAYTAVLDKNGQTKEAIKTLQEFLATHPGFRAGWNSLGMMLASQGDLQGSKAVYQKVLGLLTPPLESLHLLAQMDAARAFAGIGTTDYLAKDRAQALASAIKFNQLKFLPALPGYLSLLKLRPERIKYSDSDPIADKKLNEHILLGDMLLETKKFKESLDEYHAARDLAPNDANIHSYLLNVLTNTNDWAEMTKEDLALSQRITSDVGSKAMQEIKRNFKQK